MSAEPRWPWSELGLDGPAPEREVRRAYAARLKRLNPEEEPKAFEVLRRAYEAARSLAAAMNPPAAQPAVAQDPVPGRPPDPQRPEGAAAPSEQQAPSSGTDPLPAPEPAPQPLQPDREDYAGVLAEMKALLAARDYRLDRWQRLLAAPVLEDLKFSRQFEAALILTFEAWEWPRDKPFKTWIDAPHDWVALIETRYGWMSDGLRFQNLFPHHARLRDAFVRRMPWTAQSDTGHPVPQHVSQTDGRALFHLALNPATLGLIGIVLAIWLDVYLDDSAGPFTILALIVNVALTYATSALAAASRWVVTTRGLRRFGLARLAPFMVGMRIPGLVGSAVAMALVIGILAQPALGGFAVLEINPAAVARQRERSGLWPPFISSDSGFPSVPVITPDPARISGLGLGDPNGVPFSVADLRKLDLPYPRVDAAGARGRVDRLRSDALAESMPQRGTSLLVCDRDETCRLDLSSMLMIRTEVRLAGAPEYPQRKGLEPPKLTLSWRRDAPQHVEASVQPDHETIRVAATPAAMQELDQSYYSPGIYDSFDLPVLEFAAFPPNAEGPARLVARPSFGPGQPIPNRSCKSQAINHYWSAMIALNPDSDRLIDALCTLPADTFTLSFATCFGLSCVYKGPGKAVPLAADSPEMGETFDLPLDLALMATLRPGQALPEAAVLAGTEISHQIIEDYLTIFWDQPLPGGLAVYLQRHPEIRRRTTPPGHHDLVKAAARQPHLTYLYPVRGRIGAAVMEDMFTFLSDMRLLQPQAG